MPDAGSIPSTPTEAERAAFTPPGADVELRRSTSQYLLENDIPLSTLAGDIGFAHHLLHNWVCGIPQPLMLAIESSVRGWLSKKTNGKQLKRKSVRELVASKRKLVKPVPASNQIALKKETVAIKPARAEKQIRSLLLSGVWDNSQHQSLFAAGRGSVSPSLRRLVDSLSIKKLRSLVFLFCESCKLPIRPLANMLGARRAIVSDILRGFSPCPPNLAERLQLWLSCAVQVMEKSSDRPVLAQIGPQTMAMAVTPVPHTYSTTSNTTTSHHQASSSSRQQQQHRSDSLTPSTTKKKVDMESRRSSSKQKRKRSIETPQTQSNGQSAVRTNTHTRTINDITHKKHSEDTSKAKKDETITDRTSVENIHRMALASDSNSANQRRNERIDFQNDGDEGQKQQSGHIVSSFEHQGEGIVTLSTRNTIPSSTKPSKVYTIEVDRDLVIATDTVLVQTLSESVCKLLTPGMSIRFQLDDKWVDGLVSVNHEDTCVLRVISEYDTSTYLNISYRRGTTKVGLQKIFNCYGQKMCSNGLVLSQLRPGVTLEYIAKGGSEWTLGVISKVDLTRLRVAVNGIRFIITANRLAPAGTHTGIGKESRPSRALRYAQLNHQRVKVMQNLKAALQSL